jgi:ABC-type dipeptide/oligopeptide/nickel transport system ATPase component
MEDGPSPKSLVAVMNLREFFHDSVQTALRKQHVAVDDHTEHYVVNVLTQFARSDELYEQTPEGARLKPLAHMLADASEAPTTQRRDEALRRLGDVSLFVAGFFAQSFARKLVDVDYHIAMGGRAYGTLAETTRNSVRGQAFGAVFQELAAKFQRLVDVLNDVAEMAHEHSDKDILRQYEIWLKTGSPRAYAILRRLGVDPVASRTGALI